ncbi:uncharacterized protein B0H64DRAFT_475308 [Chaetomium fimeti]|uniref:C2H2-type domain-containing protein n=1 Tax=Chaetomium fimeti TaxID=1854472 RepID=A0AAE0HHF8_9PEZI|nr:hypothetical protein B0H64DRAFT_475308 [Chaetomium fimeti]
MLHFIEVLTAAISRAKRSGALPDGGFVWQLASDRCRGITSLFESRREPIAGFLFDRLVDGLASSVRPEDPMFLVQMWQLCVSLSRIHFHQREIAERLMFLRLFLHRMRQRLLPFTPSQEHPVLAILGALESILVKSPKSLKWTLAIGCWKSKAMLDRVFGQMTDHVSLENGAFCVQNWRSSFELDFRELEARYHPLVDNFGPHPLTEDKIAILYCYTSALARIVPLNNDATPLFLGHLAVLLDQSSRHVRHEAEAGSLAYGGVVSAFVFSTELVAKYLLEGGKYKHVLRERLSPSQPYDVYLSEAIEILRSGDVDCQVRAAELSRRLGTWLKAYCLGEKNKEKGQKGEGKRGKRSRGRDRTPDFKREKHRFSQILNRIFQTPHELRFKMNTNREGWQKDLRHKRNESRELVLVPLSREAGVTHDKVPPPERRTCRTCDVTFPSRRDMFIHFQYLKHRCGKQPTPQSNPWRQPVEIGPTIEPRALEARP